jgi:hypothetical protein
MKELQILPDETIINKIYIIREKKVMIDRDLAELYGVDTRVLNQQGIKSICKKKSQTISR